MRPINLRSIVAGVALVFSAGLATAANNPAYDSWAKVKPGSSVTLHASSEAAGQKSETDMVYTLDSVTPEKATLQVKTTMLVAGNKMELPARKMEIPKTPPAAKPLPAADPKAVAKPDVKQSEETVTVGGKAYACHIVETNTEANGMKIAAKTWTCPDVPNTIIKSESSTTGAAVTKSTMELTKIDLK